MRTIFARAFFLLLFNTFSSLLILAQLGCTSNNKVSNEAWEGMYNIIFSQNFEHHNTPIEYTTKLWNPDWNNPGWRDGDHRTEGWEFIKDSIVVDSETNSTVMKFNFKDTLINGVNGYHAVRGGDLWLSNIGAEPKELYFSYNVKFRPGFDFVKGGKLPGTRGGTPLSHYTLTRSLPPADDEGYSCYLLFKSSGRLQWYLYHHDREELYGDAITWDDYQPEGLNYTGGGEVSLDVSEEKWHNITMRVVVNTITNGVANRDGILEGFVDGKLVSSMQGLYLIPATDVDKGVNTLSIGNFFGGGGNQYGPTRDEWTMFDDFVCFTYDESVNVPRGNTPSQPGRILELPNLKTSEKTDQIPPTVPQGVRSKKKTGSFIDLIWESSQDNTGVKAYRIFVNGNEKGTSEVNSYQISGLNPETTYSIAVSAFDGYGNESARSEAIFVTTSKLDTIPPPVPTGLHIVDSAENSIDIAWDALPDTVGLEAYNVYVNDALYGTVGTNRFTIVNLEPQMYYNISLTAFDASLNESRQSQAVTGRTADIDRFAPHAPEGLISTHVDEHSINLSWNEAVDNVSVIGYNIYVNGRKHGSSDKNTYAVSSLYSGTVYSITVTAFDNAQNESAHSNEILVTTLYADNSIVPPLPELEITDLSRSLAGNDVTISTKMHALGHTDLIDYGVVVTKKGSAMEDKFTNVIYASQDESSLHHNERIQKGMQLMYDFTEGYGSTVFDKSVSDHSIDLEITNPMATTWLPGQGLKVDNNTIISSEEVPSALLSSIEETNEITIESWIRTGAMDQDGPARIVSISRDTQSRIATLGQKGDDDAFNYIARLTTSVTSENGTPEVASNEEYNLPSLHHLVYTRNNNGRERIYINGDERYSGVREGSISIGEGNNYIALANEISGERPWIGNYYLVAVYNEALDAKDILSNYQAGAGTVQYTTKIGIEHDETYLVTPFARTVQGISYGDPYKIEANKYIYKTYGDTILMEIYPNPSGGDFKIHVLCNTQDAPYAILRVSDMMGKVIFTEHISISEIYEEFPLSSNPISGGLSPSGKEIELNLSSMLNEGIYLVSIIVGNKTVGRRIIVQ